MRHEAVRTTPGGLVRVRVRVRAMVGENERDGNESGDRGIREDGE